MTDETRDETADLRREAEALRPYVDVAPEDLGVTLPTAEQLMFRADAAARRRTRRTQLLQVVAASVAVAAVVVGLSWRGGSDDSPGPASLKPSPGPSITKTVVEYRTAAHLLRAAAVAAEQQPAAADSAYWFAESLQHLPEGLSPRKIWLGHGRPSILDQDGFVARLSPAKFSLGSTSLSWDEFVALRIAPGELAGLLHDADSVLATDQSYDRFKYAAQLLGESPAPPALRGAIWRVLATTPGVRLLGPRTDSEGRSGYAVRLAAPGHPTVSFVVDPVGGRLLEAIYGPTSRGSDGWSVAYLDAGPRSEAPAPDRR